MSVLLSEEKEKTQANMSGFARLNSRVSREVTSETQLAPSVPLMGSQSPAAAVARAHTRTYRISRRGSPQRH